MIKKCFNNAKISNRKGLNYQTAVIWLYPESIWWNTTCASTAIQTSNRNKTRDIMNTKDWINSFTFLRWRKNCLSVSSFALTTIMPNSEWSWISTPSSNKTTVIIWSPSSTTPQPMEQTSSFEGTSTSSKYPKINTYTFRKKKGGPHSKTPMKQSCKSAAMILSWQSLTVMTNWLDELSSKY